MLQISGDRMLLEFIQGQKITINEITIENSDDILVVSITLLCHQSRYTIMFHNVNHFNIHDLSMPLDIDGFEVVDHLKDGYNKDCRYEICDYENNVVHFYCESYDIL